ncbi:uncharacterized protein N7511_008461 [Penicillium nucicola]|uniref:uncharacterized protein n=1 Tax=Penicillium nucicola TaxID=1850975 RepID=UPI00254574B4|nr:uncharacterized protein N7511_008461 [Penicillium nucicola]KAJ5751496.1 hypothetical protein N7511_008461 [Penicillium nucicola]
MFIIPARPMIHLFHFYDRHAPAIHYGSTASADQLIADAVTRNKILARENILCFDLGAAGIMNLRHCLAIRGIHASADSHGYKLDWICGIGCSGLYEMSALPINPERGRYYGVIICYSEINLFFEPMSTNPPATG